MECICRPITRVRASADVTMPRIPGHPNNLKFDDQPLTTDDHLCPFCPCRSLSVQRLTRAPVSPKPLTDSQKVRTPTLFLSWPLAVFVAVFLPFGPGPVVITLLGRFPWQPPGEGPSGIPSAKRSHFRFCIVSLFPFLFYSIHGVVPNREVGGLRVHDFCPGINSFFYLWAVRQSGGRGEGGGGYVGLLPRISCFPSFPSFSKRKHGGGVFFFSSGRRVHRAGPTSYGGLKD